MIADLTYRVKQYHQLSLSIYEMQIKQTAAGKSSQV